jgi:hypothetical protein
MHIIYVNDFNHDGAGFHQFIDPEDKQVRARLIKKSGIRDLFEREENLRSSSVLIFVYRNIFTPTSSPLMLIDCCLASINRISR